MDVSGQFFPSFASTEFVFFVFFCFEVKEIPALHVDGVRATRARYPNMPHGIEVFRCGW